MQKSHVPKHSLQEYDSYNLDNGEINVGNICAVEYCAAVKRRKYKVEDRSKLKGSIHYDIKYVV